MQAWRDDPDVERAVRAIGDYRSQHHISFDTPFAEETLGPVERKIEQLARAAPLDSCWERHLSDPAVRASIMEQLARAESDPD